MSLPRLGRGNDDTGWHVSNADTRLASVAMLATGTGATEVIYAEVFFVHSNLVPATVLRARKNPFAQHPSPFTLSCSHATR